jgi:hypothetical protein
MAGGNGEAEGEQSGFDAAFVCGIEEGEEERDGDGFGSAFVDLLDEVGEFGVGGAAKDLAFGGDAFRDAEAKVLRDKADVRLGGPGLEPGTCLPADGDGVFEALRRDEGDTRAFAFEHRVGADCCPMAEVGVFGASTELGDALHDGGAGIVRGGAEFEDLQLAIDEGYAVGEGSSRVDGDAQTLLLSWGCKVRLPTQYA